MTARRYRIGQAGIVVGCALGCALTLYAGRAS